VFTYAILHNLPKIPDRFINQALEIADRYQLDQGVEESDYSYKNRMLVKDGMFYTTTYRSKFPLPELQDWVTKHIHPDGFDSDVSITSAKRGQFHGPHTDKTRRYALLYNISSGGDCAETVFYREPAKPLVLQQPLATALDLDQLEIIERVSLPLRQWVILNSLVLHGVENLSTDRISFQVGINENIWFQS